MAVDSANITFIHAHTPKGGDVMNVATWPIFVLGGRTKCMNGPFGLAGMPPTCIIGCIPCTSVY